MRIILGSRLSIVSVCFVIVFFWLHAVSGRAQTQADRQVRLQQMYLEANEQHEKAREAVLAYSREKGVPVVQRFPDGSTVLLYGIDGNGNPVFVATDNAGAAITTGVDKVRDGGGLGLNLTGEGVRVSIWDGGKLNDHIEFAGRIQLNEGSSDDNHATHVMGTIGAEGINPLAKGMAPKAMLTSWDFENDLAEMISQSKPDQSGTLLSNHSYDQVSGWRFNNNQWTWFGDASISPQEDWRFGFYGSLARSWDELAFNSPYYTIVKSAGNDRGDIGNGSRPPDCNAGSGYDCIGVRAVAKNIITVGAIRKLTDYQEPANVQMSSFSAWGPTDDGRIKPDLVAAGVEVFSTSGVGINQYTTLNGTSMATPNVTGSLVLIQQLYRNLNNGRYMRASALKALAIHTAKEAGSFPGPDYSYGWGVLDIGAAAKVLLDQDNQNVFVLDDTLRQGQTYSMRLQPQAGKKITATLVWTDPPGIPVAASLDPVNRMLVNDLDLRIRNEAGGIVEPWILDPGDPAQQATKGNNNRDNVEKIEFNSPDPRDYILEVRHKGNVTGPYQVFSLVLTYTSLVDPRPKLHWVGGNGNWHDPAKWSSFSGGAPANRIPSVGDRVIFDENSFRENSGTVVLSGPAECFSLTFLAARKLDFDLRGNKLEIRSSLVATSADIKTISAGELHFVGENISAGELTAPKSDFGNVRLRFSGPGSKWQVKSDLKLASFELFQGTVLVGNNTIETKQITMGGTLSRSLETSETRFAGVNQFFAELQPINLVATKTTIEVSGTTGQPGVISNGGLNLPFDFTLQGVNRMTGSGQFASLIVSGDVEIQGNNNIGKLNVSAGSTLRLANNSAQTLSKETTLSATAASPITIRSTGKATLDFTGHYKLCFDFLNVINVDLSGTAVVNAGSASTLSGSGNWFSLPCADVLFPDFNLAFACKDGLTQFSDNSSGLFDQRSWSFGSNLGTSIEKNPSFQFRETGVFPVTLTLSKSGVARGYTRMVNVGANNLQVNEILFSSSTFFSTIASGSYQWYRDMQPIDGAKSRSYSWNGEPGQYFVLIANEQCNRPSNTIVITGLSEVDGTSWAYPNAVDQDLFVDVEAGTEISLINVFGAEVWSGRAASKPTVINTTRLSTGIYFIRINTGTTQRTQKILVIH